MSDIVEKLHELERVERELAHECDCPPEATANWKYAETCKEAADEITKLRAALREIDSITVHSGGDIDGVHPTFWEVAFKQAQDTARAALGGEDD